MTSDRRKMWIGTRWWAAVLLAALPCVAGASVLQVSDRYTFLEGAFAGQILSLETRFAAPEPGLPQLTTDGVARVTFLGLSATDEDALVVSDTPSELIRVEIYAYFEFAPASNPAGLAAISMDPSGGFLVLFEGPGEFDFIEPSFGRDGGEWQTDLERSLAPIPLPPGGVLLLGAVGAALTLGARRGAVPAKGSRATCGGCPFWRK